MKVIRGAFSFVWKLHVGLVFVLTTLLFYPIIVPFLLQEKTKKRAFRLFVIWGWAVRLLCLYHVQKEKLSSLPSGTYIIVANHSSYLDIFLIYTFMSREPFIFLGKTEILSYPLIKTYFKWLNIPVDRKSPVKSARALVSASRKVKEGWSLVIFPEGGIPNDNNPKMIEFKEGAFQIAKNLNIPIVPLTYLNNYRLLSDPSNLFGPAMPGVSRVHIHPYFTVEEINKMSQKELSKACFDRINAPILKEHPEFNE